jgi:hypothetical protein
MTEEQRKTSWFRQLYNLSGNGATVSGAIWKEAIITDFWFYFRDEKISPEFFLHGQLIIMLKYAQTSVKRIHELI